jgi:hypothetical protein
MFRDADSELQLGTIDPDPDGERRREDVTNVMSRP